MKNITHPGSGITLITDGGPENNLKDFLAAPRQIIEHRIALVDVYYSNSLIEAHNKIIKYNYLYRMDIPDGQQLRRVFPSIVDDFNNRPHVSLAGLTPNEAEQSLPLNREQLCLYTSEATEKRIKYNLTNQCNHCRD